LAALVLGGLAIACLGLGCAPTPSPPNVLLISIDSLRPDHLHCYGYGPETSPNIDRLAAEGVVFEHVIADSSWTLPTHVSLLTGLTSQVHRVTFDGHRLAPERTTLPEVLGAAGYRTHGIWSGPYLHPIFGFDQGFGPGDYVGVIGPSAYDDPDFFGGDDPREVARTRRQLNQASHRTITSPAVTRRAVDFLEAHGNEPFFLFLHYFDVHYDYVPPEEIWRRFDPDYRGNLTSVPFSDDGRINREMPEGELRHLRALYDGEIFFTDHYVGRLLDALERLGLADETLVVLTSDHGEEFFEHGEKGHRKNLFDETLRVPLVLRLPGHLEAGTRVTTQARHIDVLPTILDLLGLDGPEEVQGRSLVSASEGEAEPASREALSRLVLPGSRSSVALRTAAWKLIVRGDEERSPALYDLVADPDEARPLEAEAHAQRLADAESVLARWETDEARLAASLPSSEIEIEVPQDVRDALEQLGYGE
jgi:arylsulfatase A-like enzyme